MRTSIGILLLAGVLIAGVFVLRWRNPEAFGRLQTDVVALFSSPSASESPAPSGTNGISKALAAPAVHALAKQAAAESNALSAPAAPITPPTAAPAAPVASAPAAPTPPVQSAIPSSPLPAPQVGDNGNSDSESAAAAAAQVQAAAPKTIASWTPPATIPAKPNWTWTTSDGHTYKNVKVLKIDPDAVTILHEDGGTQVQIATLPPDIQKQLNYDPQYAANWMVGSLVSGKLLALKNGAMLPVDDSAIRPVKYFAIYYSAQWCPPCHKFTPDLVKFYNEFKPSHPDFELIFISEDHSADLMLAYMKEMSMPWLAVDFGTLVHPGGTFKAPGIEGFANDGIPDLVLVDATGKVLSDSYQNGQYVGPEQVINDIKTLVQ